MPDHEIPLPKLIYSWSVLLDPFLLICSSWSIPLDLFLLIMFWIIGCSWSVPLDPFPLIYWSIPLDLFHSTFASLSHHECMVWLFSRAAIILYLMPLTPYQNPLSPHHCRPMLSDDVALAKFSQAQSFRACHSSCYTSFDSTIFRHALSCTPSHQIALLLLILQTTKGGGMYLIFPVIIIVIVTVTVFLQCLSCSLGQN